MELVVYSKLVNWIQEWIALFWKRFSFSESWPIQSVQG